MGRKILAVVAALVAAFGVIVVFQLLFTLVIDPPSPVVMNDPASLQDYVAGLPASAFILLAVGYAVASLAAGYVIAKMTRRLSSGVELPLIAGIVLTLLGVMNFFYFFPGSPLWATALSLVTFIPFAVFGHSLGKDR